MRPRLFDAYCGAGGCTRGYQLAGFHVTGVDLYPQPNYCGDEFIQADALETLCALVGMNSSWSFDAIHASPPCPAYANVTRWRGNQDDHPALIEPTRRLLEASGLPWVMENVRTKECRADFMICGTTVGLPIRRHRHFETNWSGLVMSTPCQHRASDLPFMHKGERAYADALECEWMTAREARQAVPPRYTQLIGAALIEHLTAVAA